MRETQSTPSLQPGDLVTWSHPSWTIIGKDGRVRPFHEPCLVLETGVSMPGPAGPHPRVAVFFAGRRYFTRAAWLAPLHRPEQ